MGTNIGGRVGGGLSNVNPRAAGCMTLAFLSFPSMLVSILCAQGFGHISPCLP